MVLHGLGVRGDLVDEHHRRHEVAEAVGALDLLAGLRPFGQRREFGGDLGFGELDERHRTGSVVLRAIRSRTLSDANLRAEAPMQEPSLQVPSTAPADDRPRTTRLAPTPSGSLHVGNARTFLLNWALARAEGWRVVLRLEDLDIGRVKDGALEASIADLRALGLDWDGEPEIQSRDLSPYQSALTALAARGELFRCDRSRSEIRSAASAPHSDDGETRYPPELRPPHPWPRAIDAWEANHRLRVDPAPEPVHDELVGQCAFDPGLEAGDLVVWTKQGVPAYQLAVVVDDARHGVTDVVRGDDLLASAARQQLLARALGLPHARWWHLPLVYGDDGKRLAKRHGSHSLRELFASGVQAERITGWCAWSIGLIERCEPISREELIALTSPRRLRDAIRARNQQTRGATSTFTAADLAWLTGDVPDPAAPST